MIPEDLYEAASVDGANKLQQFWRITFPLLRPAILVVLIFRTLDALRVYDVFAVFFGNRLGQQSMAVVAQGAIVNSLSALVMDPNVSMHEGKAFVCNVEKA